MNSPPPRILIIGATSTIAQAVARCYVGQQATFYLVGRAAGKLAIIATDLLARGATTVHTQVLDLNEHAGIESMVQQAGNQLGQIDIALIAHGSLPDQARTEHDLVYALDEFQTNATSMIVCMQAVAQHLAQQRSGVLAVIGSVAGDRGRGSNYLYGAAKAAVATYASGLRARLFREGVHVLVIKPGFVATPMTAHLELPARLVASPEQIAQDIVQAIHHRRDVLYTPHFWWLIMMIIKLIPSVIFNRLRL